MVSGDGGGPGGPGNVVSAASGLHCPHGGRVFAVSGPGGRGGVRVDGHAVQSASDVFAVAGCRHTVNGTPEPCLSVRWSPRPGGVLVDGAPVLLGTSGAQCLGAALVPQGAVVVTAGRGGVVCR